MEIIIVGIFISSCFLLTLVSFYLGYQFAPKEEKKEIPKIKRKKEVQEEIEDPVRIMLENIDNYDGTARGQQDVPEDEEEW